MLRIGLIGAGWVTQYHLEADAPLADRVTVAALADPIAQARERRAQAHSGRVQLQ